MPPGGEPPARLPTAGAYWDNLSERRLDYLNTRLSEAINGLGEVSKELRSQTRSGDQQASTLIRFDERLRGVEREITEMPKRLERAASAEWLLRLENRVDNLENEAKSPFVRKIEFEPVKKVVFGLVTSLCLAVLAAVARLVMK